MPLIERLSPKAPLWSLGAKPFRIFVGLGDGASSRQVKTLEVPGVLTNKGRWLEPGEGYGRDEDMHLTDATGFEEVTEGE